MIVYFIYIHSHSLVDCWVQMRPMLGLNSCTFIQNLVFRVHNCVHAVSYRSLKECGADRTVQNPKMFRLL